MKLFIYIYLLSASFAKFKSEEKAVFKKNTNSIDI